jgi:hypothetical protein
MSGAGWPPSGGAGSSNDHRFDPGKYPYDAHNVDPRHKFGDPVFGTVAPAGAPSGWVPTSPPHWTDPRHNAYRQACGLPPLGVPRGDNATPRPQGGYGGGAPQGGYGGGAPQGGYGRGAPQGGYGGGAPQGGYGGGAPQGGYGRGAPQGGYGPQGNYGR